jgi:peptidyl-prolyl cis-trans isomerase B (cyclophilin B)
LRAVRRALLPILAVLALLAAGCGSSGKSSSSSTATTATTATQAQASTTPGGCRQVQAPQPRNPGKHRKPKAELDGGKKWALTVATNCGSFTIGLDLKTAPHAGASLVALARAHYFDNTTFHRIAPGFVIQGGDPTATGQGGPGYGTVDKPPRDARYTSGVVAMAKTGSEPPGAGGSQFFVVTGPDAQLPPDYALVGKVTSGMDVVSRIGKLGDQNEQPIEPVVISKVTVSNP